MGYSLTISGANPRNYPLGASATFSGTVSWGATDLPAASMEGAIFQWNTTTNTWGMVQWLTGFTTSGTGTSRNWSVSATLPSTPGYYAALFSGTTAGMPQVYAELRFDCFDAPMPPPPPPPIPPVR